MESLLAEHLHNPSHSIAGNYDVFVRTSDRDSANDGAIPLFEECLGEQKFVLVTGGDIELKVDGELRSVLEYVDVIQVDSAKLLYDRLDGRRLVTDLQLLVRHLDGVSHLRPGVPGLVNGGVSLVLICKLSVLAVPHATFRECNRNETLCLVLNELAVRYLNAKRDQIHPYLQIRIWVAHSLCGEVAVSLSDF